jgi:predicted Zn-ribbon and HTH transcriptional regulator
MDIKEKVISIMENLDPMTRQEIIQMYAPVHEKDILPRVKKVFQLVQKMDEMERDQLLKLIYNDNEIKTWQQSEELPEATEEPEL